MNMYDKSKQIRNILHSYLGIVGNAYMCSLRIAIE